MASKAFLIAVAMAATIVAPTMAKEILVGGADGWRLGINYQAWADGIEFDVGDTLGMSISFNPDLDHDSYFHTFILKHYSDPNKSVILDIY